jgi:hypothetical protein
MKEGFLVSENTQNPNHGKKMMWAVHSFFILGALVSAFLAFYYILVHRPEEYNINIKLINETWFNYIVLFLTSSILFVCGSRLKLDSKIRAIKVLLAIYISVYVAELYLNFKPKYYKSRQFEVVEKLRQMGLDAQRDIGGIRFIASNGLETKGERIFPLGGISNKKTVMETTHNSSGLHTIIETDEHGFNNKKGLYNSGDVDIVIVGECTLEYAGENDPYEENIGEQLRKLNYKTINLAKQGSLHLLYLAALKEYAEPLKPKVVIFSAGGNLDNYALPSSPLLNKYLSDQNFTQNLISRQIEIDNILIEYLYQNWEESQLPKTLYEKLSSFSPIETIKLTNFRNYIIDFVALLNSPANSEVSERSSERSSEGYSEHFVAVITMAQQLVSSWGGKLYILNSSGPAGLRYEYQNEASFEEFYAGLGIGLMHMGKEVFDVHPDPLSLLPNRTNGHPNGEAKRLWAKAIAKRLQEDGFMPRNH